MRTFRITAITILMMAVGVLMGPTHASAASTEVTMSWSYDTATHTLASSVEAPFTIAGGTSTTTLDSREAVRFTSAPEMGTYSGTSFPTPGTQDFAWTVVMSMEQLIANSSANITQHGTWNTHQLKMETDKYGVPQCVFNGTNGRRTVKAKNFGSINDGGIQHTISCVREGSRVSVIVDGVRNNSSFDVGSMTPPGKPTFGNKAMSADHTDQLFGTVAVLSVAIGPGALQRSLAAVA